MSEIHYNANTQFFMVSYQPISEIHRYLLIFLFSPFCYQCIIVDNGKVDV